jgi:hypothetical protein
MLHPKQRFQLNAAYYTFPSALGSFHLGFHGLRWRDGKGKEAHVTDKKFGRIPLRFTLLLPLLLAVPVLGFCNGAWLRFGLEE